MTTTDLDKQGIGYVTNENHESRHNNQVIPKSVRAEIVPLSDGSHRLQCKAFMVTGGRDPFFQGEVPLANVRSRPYQSLLEKVKKQLKYTANFESPYSRQTAIPLAHPAHRQR